MKMNENGIPEGWIKISKQVLTVIPGSEKPVIDESQIENIYLNSELKQVIFTCIPDEDHNCDEMVDWATTIDKAADFHSLKLSEVRE